MKETISVKNDFYKEIESLWNDSKFSKIKILERGYGIHDEIIKDSILFIGINPSYSEKKSKHNRYFINFNQEGITKGGISFPYFKKFVDISKELNTKYKLNIRWSHFDLLFFRETQQKFINVLMKEDEGVEFISRQLEISKKVISRANPKLIVVSNTKARDFMNSKDERFSMGLKFKFDDNLGTYKIISKTNLNDVPVFFTSMLTGQRALDNGSYKRLIWHMKYVIDKIDNPL